MASESALEARAKRHRAAAVKKHTSSVIACWRSQAHLSASLKSLHATLSPCQGVFDKPAHRRGQDELAPVLQLVQGLQQFEGFCADAQACIAAHAELLVLQEGAELSGLQEEDPPKVYSVLSGSVLLLHGSASHPELQQLLHAARTEWAADEAAAADAQLQQQQQLCTPASAEAADPSEALSACAGTSMSTAAASGSSSPASPSSSLSCCADHSCRLACCAGSRHQTGLSHPGVWQRVMAAVSHNSRQQLQDSMDARASPLATAPSAHLQQQQQQHTHNSHHAAPLNLQMPVQGATAAGVAASLDARLSDTVPAAERESSLWLSVAKRYQSFSVSKFTCPTADSSLLACKPPSMCVAAAASPNSVAAVLAVSKPVYMEALRLHQEHHLASTLDTICRIPALRHAPLKELTRLAGHLKQAAFTKGQSILRQGQEVADIHFVLQGSVHLTYSAALTHAAARAAARCSATGGTQQAGAGAAARLSSLGAADSTLTAAAGARGSSAGRFSGLALALRLEQSCFEPPVVLATRGPGTVIGDDAVRDRRLAVGVVATEDGVVTLRMSPQKFLASLDPLTLRLFSRIRQQQDGALQDAITAAAAAAASALDDPSQQQPAADATRLALLGDIYGSNIPSTLARSTKGTAADPAGGNANHKPAWRSIRGNAASPIKSQPGDESALPTARGQQQQQSNKQDQLLSTSPVRCPGQQLRKKGACRMSDLEWEAQLPAGLRPEQCANLPQTVSVRQLVEVIKDVGEYRRLHCRATTASAAAITAYAASAAARAAAASLTGSPGTRTNLLLAPAAAQPQVAAAAAAAATVAAALAARGGKGSGGNGSSHTELLENCCVAVLRVQILPGQAPVGMAVLSSVLDDMYSACGAVAYDEGLQVVRWGPGSFILLAPVDAGVPEAASIEVAADVLLTAAARLSGLMLRAEGGLPMVRLAAGLAHGSSFLDYEAGNFVSAVSGRGLAAAARLCELASTTPAWALPSQGAAACASQWVLMVSDGVASALQAGNSYSLQAAGGGHMLLTARAALPLAPSLSNSPSGRGHGQQPGPRNTLGPGRHTILGLGVGGGLPPVTPKTPSSLRRRLGSFGGARAQMRRQIRRKFEAMASFLAGAGELPPPPESMLTQPPPPAQTAFERAAAAAAAGPTTPGGFAAAVGSGSFGGSRPRTVGFKGAAEALSGGGSSINSSHSNAGAAGRGRPALSISVDSATGTGLEDGSAPASALGSNRHTPSLQSAGRGERTPAGKLKWGAEQQGSSAGAAALGEHTAAAAAAHPSATGQQLGVKQGAGAKRSKQPGHRGSAAGSVSGARHASIACSQGAAALRHSAAGASALQGASHAPGASGTGGQGHTPCGSGSAGASSSSGSSSGTRLRQQVWQEVAAMRAAGVQGSSLPGSVSTALAAARSSAAGLSWSGGWGSRRHGSVSCWGPTGASTGSPPRPSSPLSTFIHVSPSSSRPASPLLQPAAEWPLRSAAAGASAAADRGQQGGGAREGQQSVCGVHSRHSGVGSLVSLSGGLVSAPVGALLGAAAAREVSGSIARTNIAVEKAVCFLTPRTQAAAAAAAGSAAQGQHSSSHTAAAAHSAALQRLHEGAAQHSGQLPVVTASCHSSTGAAVASWSSDDQSCTPGSLSKQQALSAKQAEEQQLRLVHSTCKALGSGTAAEAYVASLPGDTLASDFSGSGLVQLPSLHGLSQLQTLTASFNKLAALTGLLPASKDAVTAAAAAAAAEALDAYTKQLNAGGRSTTSSRPGTAGSCGGCAGGGSSWGEATGCAVPPQQQQQVRCATTPPAQPRPPSPAASGSRRGGAAASAFYDAALQQHVRELQRLRVPSGVSALPASLLQLQLAHNQLVLLPPELPAALPALTLLDLSHNKLAELPATIGGLLDLKALFVGHNQLQQLPGSISRLQQLHTLHAEHNRLVQLPAGLPQLSSLSSLHVQRNSLQTLPEGFMQLRGLTSLGLGFNGLRHLPQGLLCGLSGLRQLDVSGNGLEDLALQQAAADAPAGVSSSTGHHPGASALLGSSGQGGAGAVCSITPTAASSRPGSPASPAAGGGRLAPPPSMAAELLPHLVSLDVSHNALTQLPLWLPGSLAWLSAGHNSISELSPALCARLGGSLVGLELHSNQLVSLPGELKCLRRLQLLSLDSNPGLHPDVAEKGAGLSWAYRWLADEKQAAATAAVKASQRHKQH